MNWTNFQTYNDAPTKAFEILCNQLFENWCKEAYASKVASFNVVNGAGGDGGVESYAVLTDGKIIGLQAKWFPDSITANQMGQIKNSINTALKMRPQIMRYIVCVPRDLSSLTAKSDKTEEKRWEDMRSGVLEEYPDLILELWNETRLTKELQKNCSAGIFKFWFRRAEISEECIKFSFEKSKNSWLSTKYIPELNTYGRIHDSICTYLGDVEQHKKFSKFFAEVTDLYKKFYSASDELMDVCGENDPELVRMLNETKSKIQTMQSEGEKIQAWLENESIVSLEVDEKIFLMDFDTVADQLKENKEKGSYYFFFSAVIKVLQMLDKAPIQLILNQILHANERKSLIFLGEPGTGKTHGIAAETERLLKEEYHVPILIQARDISVTATWKDILISNLGLSNSWSEEEIWQGLTSLANRKKFHALDSSNKVVVLPKIMIVVDGVDESFPHDKWVERIQETETIVQNYPLIRFVFMSRPYVFSDRNSGGKIINVNVNGDVAPYELFDSYAKAYNINASGVEWVKYALTTPLALKLFCELNEGKSLNYYSGSDVSIANLLKEKIQKLEREYCKEDTNAQIADQNIFRAILTLENLFRCESRGERSQIINLIVQRLSVSNICAKKMVNYLENYGILRPYCEHGSGLLLSDTYYYYPGIQGYFDYASALMLIDEYKIPQDIDFDKCKKIPRNTYYILAIISIQKFDYLITDNESIGAVIGEAFKEELFTFALRYINPVSAEKYKSQLLLLMGDSAERLKIITNKLILPLARENKHPLGVALLDKFLNGFQYPAQRDVLWSVPNYLKDSQGKVWHSSSEVALGEKLYSLTSDDTAEGLPTVYAWALSTVDNMKRQTYRIDLMKWARKVPDEFYQLFLKFSTVNDPQIRSDIFSILMSLVFEDENTELLTNATKWLMENILAPDKIEENRDIAIRHYSTSIIRKAISLKVVDPVIALQYLPPYLATSNEIALSEEALAGTYMGGYKGITYDLGRYVLSDHITSVFPIQDREIGKQYEKLIEDIAKNHPKFKGISSNQFILSVAYEFISRCGWNEKFWYYKKDGQEIWGIDLAIYNTHWPQTHGSQSPIMTICEKYVWQARNYISGFLSDRLKYADDDGANYMEDYGLADDFVIPALEIGPLNPEDVTDLYPWHIPERNAVIISGKPKCQDDIKYAVQTSPDITWQKWIEVDNAQRQYPIDGNRLIALYGYLCFEGSVGVETNLYLNTILIDTSDVDKFVRRLLEDTAFAYRISNPTDWSGGCSANCYMTPKEMCWMPWKKRYDSSNIYNFPDLKIHSAVDTCTYNFIEYGDVSYELPSAPIREMLKIMDTDGYLFYDQDKKIKAANVLVGESWGTREKYLFADNSLLQAVEQSGNTLLWIMCEQRRESAKARERFEGFYTEKERDYIGFFRNKKFITFQISLGKGRKGEADGEDASLSNMLKQYGIENV